MTGRGEGIWSGEAKTSQEDRNSKCKDPREGTHPACWRNSEGSQCDWSDTNIMWEWKVREGL